MKRVAILAWDDLHNARDGTLVKADIEVKFGWFGKDYELDLTQQHYAELHKMIQPYLEAARRSGIPAREQAEAEGRRTTAGLKLRDWERGREYGRGIRQFAKDRNLGYLTTTGKYYYSRELRDAYAEFLGIAEPQGES